MVVEAYLNGEKNFVKLHFYHHGSFAASLNNLLQLPAFNMEKSLQVYAFSIII
ncbi:TPA: DUF5951 family protein [Citrobacter freundii]